MLAPHNHCELAAAVLRPYVSEKTYWIVKHHGIFQAYYYAHLEGGDRHARDRFREDPYYQDTKNHAVNDEGIVGKLVPGTARVSHFNFHADATQAFIGADRKPTVFVLAKPTKNPRPEDFVGFYSDGALGMSLFPDVWHTSRLPVEGSQEYENTQGNQYREATVDYDFCQEGVALEVALEEPQES